MRRRSAFASAVVLVTIAVSALTAVPAGAGPASCDSRNNNTIKKLLECVTLEGVREHQAALQAIADANGGVRTSGTPGYDASADYVVDRLEAAGYDVTRQPFDFAFFQELATPALDQTAPTPTTYTHDVDFSTMSYSGSGNVTAPLTAVDLLIPPVGGSTSGCEAADFTGFTAGHIALVQRGTCTFATKAVNAEAAGAVGVIIFNEGNAGRTGLLFGTLGEPVGIPVTGTTFALGDALRNGVTNGPTSVTMHMFTSTISEIRSTENIFAETKKGNDGNVVMVGAHLDSVSTGPGIQDNGSGSAAILDVAEAMRKVKPTNTVRFAWWGAEESGLVGSNYYVDNLTAEELDDIALYLNFDMVGSPNYVRFVYDGDGTVGPVGPPGSGAIEALLTGFYSARGLASEPTSFDGRSDYGPFIAVGIPAGGLFTGAEGIKTAAQVAVYGGTAGAQYDPCYHLACDTFANVSLEVLDLNSDSIAFATLTYAMDTSSVTGP